MSIPALLSSTSLSLSPIIDLTQDLATCVLEFMVQVLKQGQVVLELAGQAVVKQEEAGAVSGWLMLRVGGVEQGRGRGWCSQLVVWRGGGGDWVVKV